MYTHGKKHLKTFILSYQNIKNVRFQSKKVTNSQEISIHMVKMNYSALGLRFEVIVIANKLWCKISDPFANISHAMYVPILLDYSPSTKWKPSEGLWMLRLNNKNTINISVPHVLNYWMYWLCVHSSASLTTQEEAHLFCLRLNYKYLPYSQ